MTTPDSDIGPLWPPPRQAKGRRPRWLWPFIAATVALAVAAGALAVVAFVAGKSECEEWNDAMARIDQRAAARVREMDSDGTFTQDRAQAALEEEMEREFGSDWSVDLGWGLRECR